ncbi:MAG: alpha-E domain-containing protein [Gammaproteobacteria bacterium]|nr:alpha-E domain-containing protein [Gammaproteobacteria bacterium]
MMLVLSRVAESLYWMTRYLERAENTARLINATTQVLLDLPRGASFGWDVLLKVAGLDRLFEDEYSEQDEANIMRFLVTDERNPSSIVSCICVARENCRTLREAVPSLAWERINSLYLFVNSRAAQAGERTRRYGILEEIIERLQAVIGLLGDCMSHDVAYQFIKLGRYIERADMTTRIVDIHAAVLVPRQQVPEDPTIGLLWMGVLKSLNAYQSYRRHVSVHVRTADVVNYLLKDPHFPRTVQHCLDEIEACLAALPHNMAPLKLLRIAQRRLDAMPIEILAPALRHEYLDAVQSDLAAIHAEIAAEYFQLYEQPDAPQAAATA